MNRLFSAMKMDVLIQWRNQLYVIGIVAALAVAIPLGRFGTPEQMFSYVPTVMLLVVGGSTLLYVSALILFEKDQGTLRALLVSPLTTGQYLWSKIITLTFLATFEAVLMIGGGMAIMWWSNPAGLPNLPILLTGIIAIGIIYTLMGIVLVVRYDKITDFLMPMGLLATILQLPFLYFLGWFTSPLMLIIPTSAPTVIMQGAYISLQPWQWVYGIGYTAALIIGLIWWSYRAFEHHIIQNGG